MKTILSIMLLAGIFPGQTNTATELTKSFFTTFSNTVAEQNEKVIATAEYQNHQLSTADHSRAV